MSRRFLATLRADDPALEGDFADEAPAFLRSVPRSRRRMAAGFSALLDEPVTRRRFREEPRVEVIPGDDPLGPGDVLIRSGATAEQCRVGGPVKTGGDGSGEWIWGFPCRNKSCAWCFRNVWWLDHLKKATERLGPSTRRAFLDDLPPRPDHAGTGCTVSHRVAEAEQACAERAWWAGLFENGRPVAYVYPLPDGRDLVIGNLREGLGEVMGSLKAVDDAVRRMAVGQDVDTGLVYRVASRGRVTRIIPPDPGDEPREIPEPGDTCVKPTIKDPWVTAAALRTMGIDAEARRGKLYWGPLTPAQWARLVEFLDLRTLRHQRWEGRCKRREWYALRQNDPGSIRDGPVNF